MILVEWIWDLYHYFWCLESLLIGGISFGYAFGAA